MIDYKPARRDYVRERVHTINFTFACVMAAMLSFLASAAYALSVH